ncbi:MAG: GTPase Era, partial [Ignavibacteriaceae bacterium]|nr:GTPase Era [Ignavibacteriaceae bacterium]
KRILGILSGEDFQIVFLDTPGILKPHYMLQERMMQYVDVSVRDADIVVLMIDMENDPKGEKFFNQEFVKELMERNTAHKLLILNKIDKSNESIMNDIVTYYENDKRIDKIIPISATLGANVNEVVNSIKEELPENPKFYPEDNVSDENERFFVSEIIREKIFEHYKEEIPYSTEVLIADFKEQENRKDVISAEIVVERESQKGIIIGKRGEAIKRLGEKARIDIEKFLDRPVFLELRVKVRAKWRSDENMLKSFGYTRDKE